MRLLDFLPNKRLIVDVTDKKRILAAYSILNHLASAAPSAIIR